MHDLLFMFVLQILKAQGSILYCWKDSLIIEIGEDIHVDEIN